MQQTQTSSRRSRMRRALSLFLAAVMALGLFPALPAAQASAHWADPYLSQLMEWGVISSAQAQNPDRALTRADFMGIVNRAYGYHEPGETPFEDIKETDWFYDDVGIAYTARYIKGTSPTTASPKDPLTRETAATILGRNMMLQDSAGEILDFTDARRISTWAQGTIKSSLEHYLVSGYDDGTFRPQRNVSWGEMASMVSKLVGTPLQEPGEYSLGGTFGNVTITSPGVTLRDTVVSGDLYVTGGVGLGDVKLENVTVLGRIIASGTGQSEEGGASILLRNVTADELLVDNLQDNTVSVRADGVTEIGRTTVRTTAYIEDNTPDGLGLHYISLEGESYPEGEEPEDWEPVQLTLAGRVEEVVNKTPGSVVHAAAGTVAKLTVDEAAEGSTVVIDRNTVVKELNLDTTTTVTGQGDVGKLTVNAPGCVVEMLPDEIEIRPGITAEINGEEMDSVAAKESSEDPQILAGYPEARDIIPAGLDAVFMTNKAGTVYWAVSAMTDGSVGEEDLIKPPSYGNIAVRNGSVKVAKGNEETTAKITGLTPGGSYYLSAVLVDARDKRSTTKVISFTTPDNTTPAFCAGYPKMSKVSRTDSVVVVMPNKDCKLYYALLPEGAAAPTENELKTSSVAGALGYGVRDVKKNVEDAFRVNDVILDETTNYVLYLWLVDADGVNKGKIVQLKFTTDDDTPPEFIVDPTVNKVQNTSVGLTFRLNENGTVYWVAVPAGTLYPKPEPGTVGETAPPNSIYAKMQVSSGMNIGPDGKAGKVTAKENADGTINVSGLKPETTYDFYYVAKDNAGADRNYSEMVKKITISTSDDKGPVFTQSFSRTAGTDKTKDPQSNTDIYLDVNENVQHLGQYGGKDFLALYNDVKNATGAAKNVAKNLLALNLYNTVKLHKGNAETPVDDRHNCDDEFADYMVIDYTQATVESRREGGIRITFPASGLHLENGAQYCFVIQDVYDLSNNQNEIEPNPVDFRDENSKRQAEEKGHNVPPFDIGFSRIEMSDGVGVGAKDGPYERNADGSIKVDGDGKAVLANMDKSFRMEPKSTGTVNDTTSYDMVFWCDASHTDFDIYYRVTNKDPKAASNRIDDQTTHAYPEAYTYTDSTTNEEVTIRDYLIRSLDSTGTEQADDNGWILLGTAKDMLPKPDDFSGKSIGSEFNGCDPTSYPLLKNLSDQLYYEFVISMKTFKGEEDRSVWSGEVKFKVNVIAGQSSVLDQLAINLTTETFDKFTAPGGSVRDIGWWLEGGQHPLVMEWSRLSKGMPRFFNNTPAFFDIKHDSLTMSVSLSSQGTVHYVIDSVDKQGEASTPTTRTPLAGEKAILDANPGLWETKDKLMLVTWNPPQGIVPPPGSGRDAIPNWMKGTKTEGTEPGDGDPDVPDGKNTIQNPTSGAISRFDELWTGSSPAAHGSVSCGPSKPEEEKITGLEPDTDYFAYLVIDNDAEKTSHVYIYHFKTNPTAKPKIGIRPDADGSAWLWTDNSASLAYVLFTLDDAKEDANKLKILKRPFYESESNNLVDDGEYGVTGKLPSCWQHSPDDNSKPFTVLDALKTPYSHTNIAADEKKPGSGYYVPTSTDGSTEAYEGGYSVFDIYANATIRRELEELVRSDLHRDGATRIDFGSGIASPGGGEAGAFKQPLKDVSEGNEYVIITVAQNNPRAKDEKDRLDYEIDSFKAYYSIEKTAGAAPNLDNVTGITLKLDDKTASPFTYTGTLTLKFDKKLYTGTPKEILTNTNIKAFKFQPEDKQSDIHPSTSATNTAASDTITIKIDEMMSGESIVLPGSPAVLKNASDAGADEALTITLETEEREENGYRRIYARYHVEWGTEGTDEDYKPFDTKWFKVYEEKLPTPPAGGGTTGGGTSVTLLEKDVAAKGLTLTSTSGAKLSAGTSTVANYSLKLDGSNMQSTISARVTPSEANDRVYWTSSNASVATVSGSNRSAVITGKTAGTATITVTAGKVTRTIFVTVAPGLNITSFTPNSASTTIKENSDGSYTWTRKDGGSYAAKLKFSSSLTMTASQVTVTSSDAKAVSVGNKTVSGKTGEVQLTFGSLSSSQVTITIKAGGVERKVTVKLVGSDVSAGLLAAKKS